MNNLKTIAAFFGLGAIIGLAKLLNSEKRFSWRVAIGHSILGGAMAMTSGLALVHIPDIPLFALVGLASVLGVLGANAIEALFHDIVRWLKKKYGVKE